MGKKKSNSSAFKIAIGVARTGAAIAVALSDHDSHHSHHSSTSASQRRAREEEARIRREEDAQRESDRLREEAVAHERTLKNYPDLRSDTLNKLRPLTSHQSHTPPNLAGKTLPYLLLNNHDIESFVYLINEKNYKAHLPQFGEYNPLKLIGHRDDAVLILERIKRRLEPEAYQFLADMAFAQFDVMQSRSDSMLIWLIENEKLISKITSSLNAKMATAMLTHFELYRRLFLKNEQFLSQEISIRTAFLTQLLATTARHQEQLYQTLATLYAKKYAKKSNAWHDKKSLDTGFLFDDLMRIPQKTATIAFGIIRELFQRESSLSVGVSLPFWKRILLTCDASDVRQFVEMLQNKSSTPSSPSNIERVNNIASITLETLTDDMQACAAILEPWLPIIANNSAMHASLINIARHTCDTRFEFARQFLSLSNQVIESKKARIDLLTHLFTTTESKAKTIHKWYFKNECYYLEDLFDDLVSIKQRQFALEFIKSVSTTKTKFASYSEGFLARLVQLQTLSLPQLIDCLDILYPTFSMENVESLRRLVLQGLLDGAPREISLVDWHLTTKKTLFSQDTFVKKSDSIRVGMLKRLFEIFQNEPEQIKHYLREWYQGKLFYLTEMNADLQVIGHQSQVPVMLNELTKDKTCSMKISPELFLVIDPLELGTSDIMDNLAGLTDKTAIRSFLSIAPGIEYKIALICRYKEAFVAEDYYGIFRSYIVKEKVYDQYSYVESYIMQLQKGIAQGSSVIASYLPPSAQPSAPPMEAAHYVEAVPVQASACFESSASACAYVIAVPVPVEEYPSYSQDVVSKKEACDEDYSEKRKMSLHEASQNQPTVEFEERSQIIQKLLLAFVKVSFEKMSCSTNVIQVARQLKNEWLQYHFVPNYIEIMYQWAKMSVLFLEIGHDNDPHHHEIAAFMEETSSQPQASWYNTFSPLLSRTGLFSSPESRIYQTIHTAQQTNKNIGKIPVLVKEQLEIEERFNSVFQNG